MRKNVSRRDFLKGLAAGVVSVSALGASAAFAEETVAGAAAAGKIFAPGTYSSVQATDFASIEVTCEISETGVSSVAYKLLSTSDSDYFALMPDQAAAYCERIAAAGSTVGVDGISGATNCTNAIKLGVNSCLAQALGIDVTVKAAASGINPQDYSVIKASDKDLSKSNLFESWKLGPLTVKNRFAKSAAFSMITMRNNPDEYINYYKRMAAGGTGLIWVENFANVWDDSDHPMKGHIEQYDVKGLIDALHEYGAVVGTQLDTMGGELGPMVCTSPWIGNYSVDDVHSWQKNIVRIAKLIQSYGFDCFEINMAANNLGQSFLSRARNNRTDEYGPQSIENRTRFACEILREIKAECGKDFPIQILINGVEECDFDFGNSDLFTTIEENREIAKALEAAGADSLHIRLGPAGEHVAQFAGDLYFCARGLEGSTGYSNRMDFDRHFQGMARGNNDGIGLNLDIAGAIKEAVSIPVCCATYNDVALAPDLFIDAIADKKVDYLMLTRPITVDPQYVNKIYENRIDEIMPCTRCLHCFFDVPLDGGCMEHCRVNATQWRAYGPTMPEGFEPLPAQNVKKVTVIGAGPSGMEAARIAASRGHDVTLYEKSSAVGGMLPFAHAVKGPHEHLDRYRNYLARQLELTGVKVVTGVEATADIINADAPDAVVIAVGGARPAAQFTSTAAVKAISIDDVLGGDLGDSVVVWGSNAQAVDTAIYVNSLGKKVTIVTPYAKEDFEKGHSVNVKEFITPALRVAGVRLYPNAVDAKVNDKGLEFTNEAGIVVTVACDTVIEALDMLPNKALAEGIKAAEVYTVGDCDTPFNIANGVYNANITARAL